MISRRQLLVRSTGGLAAARLAWPAVGATPGATGPALFLYDSSIDGAADSAAVAARAGVPVAAFRRDVGVPWLEIIEPLWRRSPEAIVGVTHGGALFCLEQLGRSHGMACTARLRAAAADSILQAATHPDPARRRSLGPATSAPVAWLLQPITRNRR